MKRTFLVFFLAGSQLLWSAADLNAEGKKDKSKSSDDVEISSKDRQVIRMMELLQMMEVLKDMDLLQGEEEKGRTEDKKK